MCRARGLPVPLADAQRVPQRADPPGGARGAQCESPEYRKLFGQVFKEVKKGAPIDFFHFGKAIAEFEFTLVFADAPIDRFARGHDNAMTRHRRSAARCCSSARRTASSCHRVDGNSNEMFSDFKEHVVGVPQVFPTVRRRTPATSSSRARARTRTSAAKNAPATSRTATSSGPRRCATSACRPGFFHNGAFANLEDAIRFHLNVVEERERLRSRPTPACPRICSRWGR